MQERKLLVLHYSCEYFNYLTKVNCSLSLFVSWEFHM